MEDFKKYLRKKGIPQWRLAEAAGMSEFSLCRALRREPEGEFRKRLMAAVEVILKETEGEGTSNAK